MSRVILSLKRNYYNLAVASGYVLVTFFPVPLFAQTPRTFSDVANIFVGYFTAIIPILVGLAVVLFFWGLVKYLWSITGDTKEHEQGRQIMVWGVIAIFVMVSIWGIVAMLQRAIFDRVLF